MKCEDTSVMLSIKPIAYIHSDFSEKFGIPRHRVTRVIREVMRLHWGEIKSGYDIVIVARPSAKDSDYGKFESAIFHLLNLHHLLKDDDLE